ncbi:hypothetical protein C3F09_11010, partial [candidate division GN15 bacterium]
EPGEIFLRKGETGKVGKYDVTFHRFDVAAHANTSDSVMSAAALVSVAYGDRKEELAPQLRIINRQVSPTVVPFDDGRSSVMIAGLRPEDGGVSLKFIGESIGTAAAQPATMVLELSRKPLITLFWLGAFVVFLGGGLSMYERRRRRIAAAVNPASEQTSLTPVSQDAA